LSILKKIKRKFLTVSLLVHGSVLTAQKSDISDYQVKAVFLFNFAQFVEWPATAFSSEQSPFVIGVVGDNPFGSYLEEVVSGEKTNTHPLKVEYYKTPEEIKTCHILFINKSEKIDPDDIIADLKAKPILTVGDVPYFLHNGGMIRFYVKNNKIQIQINLEAAEAAKLIISSKLLRIAEIYNVNKK